MTLLRLHYLLETVIIVTLISYNWVLCIEEGSQGTDGKSWDRIIENPAYRLFEPNIFSIFKIRNFGATVTTREILLAWDLVLDKKVDKKPNSGTRMLQVSRLVFFIHIYLYYISPKIFSSPASLLERF